MKILYCSLAVLAGATTLIPRAARADYSIQTIASGLDNYYGWQATELLFGGGTIYFNDESDSSGYICSVPATGGSVTTLASGISRIDSYGILRGPSDMVLDSTSIYGDYNTYESGHVFSVPRDGGSPTMLAQPNGGSLIGEIGNNLYYSGGFSGIYQMPKTGGASTLLTSGYFLKTCELDSSALYFRDYYTEGYYKLDLTTDQVTTLITGLPTEGAINVSGGYAYIQQANEIVRVPTNGGAATILGPQDWSPISDGSHYFFTDGMNITEKSIADGTVTAITTEPEGGISALTLVGSELDWRSTGGGPGTGEILAVQIPEPSTASLLSIAVAFGLLFAKRRK